MAEQEPSSKESDFYVEDASILAPALKFLITQPVFRILPSWYSANALTLSGGFCCLCVVVAIWLATGPVQEGSLTGQLLLIASAILLIAYAVFDQLDGMQARRLGTSSAFGDFIDHWVDSTIANLLPVPIMLMLGLPAGWIFVMALATLAAFWASNWEVKDSNRRLLPHVGGLESIVIGCAVFVVTAVAGIEVWRIEILGTPLIYVVYLVCIPWLLVVVANTVRRAGARVGAFFKDAALMLTSLAPLMTWILYFAPAFDDAPVLHSIGYVAVGLMGTIFTGALMRMHWIGLPYHAFRWDFFLLGFAPIAALLISPDPFWISASLTGISVFLIALYLHQGWDTFSVLLAQN